MKIGAERIKAGAERIKAGAERICVLMQHHSLALCGPCFINAGADSAGCKQQTDKLEEVACEAMFCETRGRARVFISNIAPISDQAFQRLGVVAIRTHSHTHTDTDTQRERHRHTHKHTHHHIRTRYNINSQSRTR